MRTEQRMALAKEAVGSPLMENFSFVSSSKALMNHRFQRIPVRSTRVVRLKKALKVPVAAISEDLLKPSVTAEKAVGFRVRAVVTVRNKMKEDFRETILKHFDALTDQLGRNVVLQLVSIEIDPSKVFIFFFSFSISGYGRNNEIGSKKGSGAMLFFLRNVWCFLFSNNFFCC